MEEFLKGLLADLMRERYPGVSAATRYIIVQPDSAQLNAVTFNMDRAEVGKTLEETKAITVTEIPFQDIWGVFRAGYFEEKDVIFLSLIVEPSLPLAGPETRVIT